MISETGFTRRENSRFGIQLLNPSESSFCTLEACSSLPGDGFSTGNNERTQDCLYSYVSPLSNNGGNAGEYCLFKRIGCLNYDGGYKRDWAPFLLELRTP